MADTLVLCYHAVSDEWPASLAVSRDGLREQVRSLLQRGYGPATFTEVVRGEVPRRAMAVTFDDGYLSVLERGLPVLSELGVPATMFVPTNHIGSRKPMSWPGIDQWVGGLFEGELRPLSWDQVRELRDAGWEIGSHTRSHPHLTDLDQDELAAELVESRQVCARELGEPCTSLAYPYGNQDGRVRAATQQAGYLAACTMRPGPHDPFRWPRVGVFPADDPRRFRLKTSSIVRRLRSSGLGQRLEHSRHERAARRGR